MLSQRLSYQSDDNSDDDNDDDKSSITFENSSAVGNATSSFFATKIQDNCNVSIKNHEYMPAIYDTSRNLDRSYISIAALPLKTNINALIKYIKEITGVSDVVLHTKTNGGYIIELVDTKKIFLDSIRMKSKKRSHLCLNFVLFLVIIIFIYIILSERIISK